MKRILILTLAALMILTAVLSLVSCDEKDEKKDDGTTDQTSTVVTLPGALTSDNGGVIILPPDVF